MIDTPIVQIMMLVSVLMLVMAGLGFVFDNGIFIGQATGTAPVAISRQPFPVVVVPQPSLTPFAPNSNPV